MTDNPLSNVFLKSWRPYFWLALAGFLLYAKTLFFGFVYYDDYYLLDNIRLFGHFPDFFAIFTQGVYLRVPSALYRPLLTASIIIDHWLGGYHYYIFHLTNIILHMVASCLVFLLILKFNYQRWQAFLAAQLFAVHPALTQAVAWFPGRNDILLAIFTIPAFIFLLDYWQTRKWTHLAGHLLFFALALLTKETAIALPLLGLSYYYLIIKAKRFLAHEQALTRGWSFTLAVWIVLKQSAAINSVQLTVFSQVKDLISNFAALPAVLILNLSKSIFPLNLSPMLILPDANLLSGLAAFIFLSALLYFSKHKRPEYVIFGLIWFVSLILPFFVYKDTLMIIQENRLYLPLIGVGILILESDMLRKANPALLAGSLAILLIFSSQTLLYSDIYRDRLSFWTAVTEGSPGLPEGHVGLGNCYRENKLLDKAEREYAKATTLAPLFATGWYNLSLIFFERGEISKAEQLCQKALGLEPDMFEAYNFLGVIALRQNKPAKAEKNFQKALSLNPDFEDALSNLKGLPK